MNTVTTIKSILEEKFSPTQLEILDETEKHHKHRGFQQGKGHYHLIIQAAAFEGQSQIACHRMIYQALGDLMKSGIHALSIEILGS